jgi:hypothetical protein
LFSIGTNTLTPKHHSETRRPTATLTGSVISGGFLQEQTFTITVSFDQPVAAFSPQLLNLTNAEFRESDGVQIRGDSYSLVLYCIADGLVSVLLPANVTGTVFGWKNFASTPLTFTFKLSSLDVRFSSKLESPTLDTQVLVDVKLSEAIGAASALASSFQLDKCKVLSLTGSGKLFSLKLRVLAAGEVSVVVPAGLLRSVGGTENQISSTFRFEFNPCLKCNGNAQCIQTLGSLRVSCQCAQHMVGDPEVACLPCPGVLDGRVCTGNGVCQEQGGRAVCKCTESFGGEDCSENKWAHAHSPVRTHAPNISATKLHMH